MGRRERHAQEKERKKGERRGEERWSNRTIIIQARAPCKSGPLQ